VSRSSSPAVQQIWLEPLHPGQARAYRALIGYRFMALRCGRRFGKTALAKSWAAQGLLQGEEVGWFAPEHKHMAEVYADLKATLASLLVASAKTPPALRLSTGGRVDFWSLENPISARGRRYHRVVIDEAAFAKNGDVSSDDSMMAIWEKAIKPTLFDYGGTALVCSNSAGKNPDNFFYNLCNDPRYGFVEFHAKTMDNPLLPKRADGEPEGVWRERRSRFLEDLRVNNDPLVYAQEYMAEFVDWSGAAFFSREKLLVENRPVPLPPRCDAVFAVIDTASKTGTDNDATAVTFFAYDTIGRISLFVLD
jgi:hypothetical protein